jgi:hypothetical protein
VGIGGTGVAPERGASLIHLLHWKPVDAIDPLCILAGHTDPSNPRNTFHSLGTARQGNQTLEIVKDVPANEDAKVALCNRLQDLDILYEQFLPVDAMANR